MYEHESDIEITSKKTWGVSSINGHITFNTEAALLEYLEELEDKEENYELVTKLQLTSITRAQYKTFSPLKER